jgi:Flp pilus assembly protein TadG
MAFRAWFRRWCREETGSVASVFALALIPTLVLLGSTIDYNGAVSLRSKLQASTDATAIASAKYLTANPSASDTAVSAFAKTFFDAQMKPESGSIQPVGFERNRTRVIIQTSAIYNTKVIKAGSIETITVAAKAAVDRGTTALEVALVLDNTGSMLGNDRIGKLRVAAEQLVSILEGARTPERPIRIALVPFVTAVNVKGESFKMSWIDQQAKARYHGQNFDLLPNGNKVNHLSLFTQMNIPWKGCVEARPEPYDIADVPPSSSNPDTLFVPYFWPDEPDPRNASNQVIAYSTGTQFWNNYLRDLYTKPNGVNDKDTAVARQKSTAKYVASNVETNRIDDVPNDTNGPNASCPTPIVPLTADFTKIKTAIRGMQAWNRGGTNITEGLSWGERVLSRAEPYTEGAEWGDSTVQKVVILLTDGENLIYGQNNKTISGSTTHNKSDYSSIGYLSTKRYGTDDPDTGKAKLLDRMKQACAQLKQKVTYEGTTKEKAMVYTITFEIPSQNLKSAFAECATRPDMYYDSPTSDQIGRVFETIAWQLASLRISY